MKYLFLILLFVSSTSQAGWLVRNATVKEVSNTIGNLEVFFIDIAGGTGMCANQRIEFPRAEAGSDGVVDRAFAIALSAYLSGAKIKVYDYDEGLEDCGGAETIRMVK